MSLFKDLEKVIQSQQQTTADEDPKMQALLQKVRNKPFFNWGDSNHKHIVDSDKYVQLNDCFNCIIGWPEKNKKRYPLFNYENDIIKAIEIPNYVNVRKSSDEDDAWYQEQLKLLEQKTGMNKHESVTASKSKILQERHERLIHPQKVGRVAILKSRGLGVTTLLLRYLAFVCMKDDKLKGTDICLITGPRESLSIDLINRLKQLFLPFDITFETKETTLFLNGVRIRSFPSNNISAMRGLAACSWIYADESAYFDKNSQTDVIDTIEGYCGKNSQCKIVLTSTPNKVGDLMHTILSQPFDKSFYKIMRLNWEWGRGKIYSDQDLKVAQASTSWEREFNLSFNSPSGNCFSSSSIDKAVELAKKYPNTINKNAEHSLGIDPGFGSSNCAFVCVEYSDSKIKVVYAKQFNRSGFNDMIQEVWNIRNLVGEVSNVYIDMANTEFIEACKQDLGDNTSWEYIHDTLNKYRRSRSRIESVMKVVPVSFREEGASMLVHVKNLLDHEDNLIAINPKYEELISALKGAVSTEYRLDKKESVFSDLTDAFRLAAKYFRLEK
jgi:hypothetical protein